MSFAEHATHWEWTAPTGARAIFTTRAQGNLAQHVGDDAARVALRRARVADMLALETADIAAAAQVHGADVWLDLERDGAVALDPAVRWSRRDAGAVEADALVTARADAGVAVAVADCVPIAVSLGDAVGAIHAGWRSLEAGVVEAAIGVLRRAAGSSGALAGAGPHAVIGPCLGACCFEVGEDVAARFDADVVVRGDRAERPHLDARADAQRRLELLGAQVEVIDACTRCDERLFSHRGDGGATGRQVVLVTRAGVR